MINLNAVDFKQHRFAILGLGETGVSIINYLKHQKANLVRVIDTRENPPHLDMLAAKQIPYHCGALNSSLFDDIDVIALSPGVSIYDPILQQAIKNGKLIVGDVELFAQAISSWRSKVIGITGSNGKTTVTTLTGHLAQTVDLKTLVCGNIGTPVLNSYLEIITHKQIPEVIVLELSSFQLESLYNLKLDAATVLNISEDHLDRYRNMLEYAYIKDNIFNNCCHQVLNTEDPLVMAMRRSHLPMSGFGGSSDSNFRLEQIANKAYLQVGGTNLLECELLNIVGTHNYLNCLASLALLSAIGVKMSDPRLISGLLSFNGVPHRMQKILSHNNITYIEDSKGTNVGAVVAGVSGINSPVHLILGGDGKGQDFGPLRGLVDKKCSSVVLIGKDKLLIQKVLLGLNISITLCDSLEEAVRVCIRQAKSGDSIILSPACASWDMFDNYKQRAEVFVESIYENIR